MVNNSTKLNTIMRTLKPIDSYLESYNFPKKLKLYWFNKLDFSCENFFKLFNLPFNLDTEHKISILGIVNKIFDNYAYSFDKYPYREYNYFGNFIRKPKITFISHELPDFGGSASNTYSLFRFYKEYFETECIFIDNGNYLSKIQDKEHYYSIYPEMKIIHHNENVNEKLLEYIQFTDIIILRSPQVPATIDIDLKLLKIISKRIISIFGGGIRNNFSRKMEEIKKNNNINIQDYYSNYNKFSNEIDVSNELLNNDRYMKIIKMSDHISTNTQSYENIFKQHFKDRYIGYYPFSSINKTNFSVCKYNCNNVWKDREYDIILIASSLTRTVKGVTFFLNIIKNLPYKVLIVGNRYIYDTYPNVTHIKFTNNVNKYLLSSKLIISTSLYEASPNILFEGIQAGCNILTSHLVSGNNIFKDQCVVKNYININEWFSKIQNLLTAPIDSLLDRSLLEKSVKQFSNNLMNFNISNNKLVLIVTFLEENINSVRVHYSKAKNYLLADSLINLGYNVFFVTNQYDDIKYHDKYYYINHKHLTKTTLKNFSYVFIGLHNEEYLTPLLTNTILFKNLYSLRNLPSLKIICKMCNYPDTIDKYYNSYNLFYKIILQTDCIHIPTNISKNITNTNKSYNVSQIIKYCNENQLKHKFYYSEMTFPNIDYTKLTSNFNISLDSRKTNIIYMGRLTSDSGMNCVYLIKLMKLLGPNFKLWIIPGSYRLPNEFPTKKHSPKTDMNEFNKLKNYFENYKLCFDKRNLPNYFNKTLIRELCIDNTYQNNVNIELIPPITYGQHFNLINKFDIGIGFSENKNITVPQGSAKLFDYMFSNIKIVFEDGWHNTKYIEKYNFGEVVRINSTVEQFKNAILNVMSMDKNNILYDQFIKDHNSQKRCIDILKHV
jgi:hypothetical protein